MPPPMVLFFPDSGEALPPMPWVGPADPWRVLFVAIIASEIGKAVSKETKLTFW